MTGSVPEGHVATGDEVSTFALDERGRVNAFPPGAERMTKYAAHEVLGCDPFDRLCGDDAARIRAQLLAATGTCACECEGPMWARGDEPRLVRWSSFRAPQVGDVGAGYVVVAVERGQTHRLAQGIGSMRGARAFEDGALAEALAHEIRNPLNGASLHLSVLDRELGRARSPQRRAQEALAVVRSELDRISAFLVDFLEFARPQPMGAVRVELGSLLRDVVARFAGEASAREVALRMEPAETKAAALVDVHRVELALAHLVENALAAAPRGGHVATRMRVSSPGQIEIDVEDDGAGVPAGGRSVFDAFFTTKAGGTGLGLSIARRSARDHGGDVTYRREPGKTVFTLTLPAATP